MLRGGRATRSDLVNEQAKTPSAKTDETRE
jgi:hypothetical protein